MEPESDLRKNDLPFVKQVMAGSFAGIIEHSFAFPLDTIKVRPSQTYAQADSTKGLVGAFALRSKIGFLSMWKGVSTVIIGCIPAHAAYFSVYEYSRRQFNISSNSELYLFSTMATGGTATIFHDLIMTPTDGNSYTVIKQRIQLKRNTGPFGMLQSILRTEGVVALYRSFPITLSMTIPQSMIFMTVYENIKSVFFPGDETSWYFLCAGIASSFAAAITTPLDVIKTRLQTQTTKSNLHLYDTVPDKEELKYSNVKKTAKIIFESEGLRGFYRGLAPRILCVLPGAAVSWGSYEYIKKVLRWTS